MCGTIVLRYILHFIKQHIDLDAVGRVVTAVSRGIYAGSAVQCIDAKAGIISHYIFAGQFVHCHCLLKGILFKGSSVFYYIGIESCLLH